MDGLPLFVVARLFAPDFRIKSGLLDIRTSKVLLQLLLSNLGGEIGDDLCRGSFQGFCDTWELLTEVADSVFVEQGSRRSAALRSWCTSSGSEEGGGVDGGRNGSGLDLWLIVVQQFESADLRGGNRFSPRNIEREESSEDGKDDPGEDAGVKGKNAKHKVDELPDHPYLDRSSRTRSPVARIIGSSPGLGGGLAGPQLLLDAWIWGRLSQGGFDRLVAHVMNANRGKLVGQFTTVFLRRLGLGVGRVQGG